MEWVIENEIPASIERVEAVLFSARTVQRIPEFLSGIAEARVVKLARQDGHAVRVVHYSPNFSVPWWVRRVEREYTEWTETLEWDSQAHAGAFRIDPTMPDEWREYFNASGHYELEALPNGHTLRRIRADLTVRYGMMSNRIAHKIIIAILKRQYRHEAALLCACVTNEAPVAAETSG